LLAAAVRGGFVDSKQTSVHTSDHSGRSSSFAGKAAKSAKSAKGVGGEGKKGLTSKPIEKKEWFL